MMGRWEDGKMDCMIDLADCGGLWWIVLDLADCGGLCSFLRIVANSARFGGLWRIVLVFADCGE